MANNCLVTKLKASVNNDDLKKLGVVRVHVHKTEQQPSYQYEYQLIINNSQLGYTVTANGDGYISESSDLSNLQKSITVDRTGRKNIFFITTTADDYTIDISNKYTLDEIYTYSDYALWTIENFHDLFYIGTLKRLVLLSSKNETNTNDLKRILQENPNIYDFKINGKISGTLQDFSQFTNLNYFALNDKIYELNLSGDLNDLSNLTNLKSLNLNKSNITGNLNSFFANLYNNGLRCSEQEPFEFLYCIERWPLSGKTFNEYTGVVALESATKIAIYCGTNTIVADCPRVYISGYSASEISTNTGTGGKWEGKTVINCDEE